jgi:hypothetical protein
MWPWRRMTGRAYQKEEPGVIVRNRTGILSVHSKAGTSEKKVCTVLLAGMMNGFDQELLGVYFFSFSKGKGVFIVGYSIPVQY